MAILHATTDSYDVEVAVPYVATVQPMIESRVSRLRLNRSEINPAAKDVMANKDVKATEANIPYCVSSKPISMFMAVKDSGMDDDIEDVVSKLTK